MNLSARQPRFISSPPVCMKLFHQPENACNLADGNCSPLSVSLLSGLQRPNSKRTTNTRMDVVYIVRQPANPALCHSIG